MSSVQERLQIKRMPLDKWSTREKLCLVSAVANTGDCSNWMSVNRTMKQLGSGDKPADWYNQKTCAAQYGKLLEEVETPKRKKRTASERDTLTPVETSAEILHRKLTEERINEIKNGLTEMKQEYMQIKDDITAVHAADETQLREIWARVEMEMKQLEKKRALQAQFLKERAERNLEAERQWRPNLAYGQQSSPSCSPSSNRGGLRIKIKSDDTESDDSSSKPGTSPLLTSLLKSVSTTSSNTPSSVSSTSSPVVSSIRTSAPTITNLLTGATTTEAAMMQQSISKPVPSLATEILKMNPVVIESPKIPISQTTPTLSKLLDNSSTSIKQETNSQPSIVQVKDEPDVLDDETIANMMEDANDDGNDNLNKDDDQQLIDVLNGLLNEEGLENMLTDENNPIILCPELFKEDGSILEKVESLIEEVEEEAERNVNQQEILPTEDEIKNEFNEEVKEENESNQVIEDLAEENSTESKSIPTNEVIIPVLEEKFEDNKAENTEEVPELKSQEEGESSVKPKEEIIITDESNEDSSNTDEPNTVEDKPDVAEQNITGENSVDVDDDEAEEEEEDDEINESPKPSPIVTVEESDDSGDQNTEQTPANTKEENIKKEDTETIIVLDESPEEESTDEDGNKKEFDNASKSGDDDDDDDDEDDEKNNETDLEPIDLDIDETITKPIVENVKPSPIAEPTNIPVKLEEEDEEVINVDPESEEVNKNEKSNSSPESATQHSERKNSTDEDDDEEMYEDAKDSVEEQPKDDKKTALSPKPIIATPTSIKPSHSGDIPDSEPMVTVTIVDTDDDLPIEVIKEDKVGKMKRDYSRRKPDEIHISKKNDETSSSSTSACTTPTTSATPKPEDIENKPSLSLRMKLKERERSESPFVTEDEASDMPRTRRRYSSTPVIDSIPNSPASSDDREYRAWKKSIMTVYNRLCTHKYASIFLRPITDDQSQGYKNIVYRSMDLQTIKKNIDNGQIRSTSEFQRDVMLMCFNAIMSNKKENNTYIMAREMMTESIAVIDSIMETIKSRETIEKTSTTPTLNSSATKRSGRKMGNIKYM